MSVLLNDELINIVPLLSGITVSLFGFLLNIIMIQYSQKRKITDKFIDIYFTIREDLTKNISPLVILESTNNLSQKVINEYVECIDLMYYKYYDILPKEVLVSLLCLSINLSDRQHNLYVFKNNNLVVLDSDKYELFINKTLLAKNAKYYIYACVMSKDFDIQATAKINLQARNVLSTMNDFFLPNKLKKWT